MRRLLLLALTIAVLLLNPRSADGRSSYAPVTVAAPNASVSLATRMTASSAAAPPGVIFNARTRARQPT
jgi:hypothetical protein